MVITAIDAEEARRAANRHSGPIHLLITDVVMPGISGVTLAEQLIRERPNLRVLYMSGYTDGAFDEQHPLPPGTPFLEKPFALRALTTKVRSVLDA
jgi:DNA-binding NtrC family response regulator